jgi:hypothetical protein
MSSVTLGQGCQMVYIFSDQNSDVGTFRRALEWKMLVYFMFICKIYRPFGRVCGYLVHIFCVHLVHFHRFLVCCSKKNLATLHWAKFKSMSRSCCIKKKEVAKKRDCQFYIFIANRLGIETEMGFRKFCPIFFSCIICSTN